MAAAAMLAGALTVSGTAMAAAAPAAHHQPTITVGSSVQPLDTEWRCYELAANTRNFLCVRIITDVFGNWTGVDVKYEKNSGAPATIQLGWSSTSGQGNAGTYVSIAAGQTRSQAWNNTNPRGCVYGTMNVKGQGHYDTLPYEFCS
jgi:hypothetical protein